MSAPRKPAAHEVRRLRAALGELAESLNAIRADLTRGEAFEAWRAARVLEQLSAELEQRANTRTTTAAARRAGG